MQRQPPCAPVCSCCSPLHLHCSPSRPPSPAPALTGSATAPAWRRVPQVVPSVGGVKLLYRRVALPATPGATPNFPALAQRLAQSFRGKAFVDQVSQVGQPLVSLAGPGESGESGAPLMLSQLGWLDAALLPASQLGGLLSFFPRAFISVALHALFAGGTAMRLLWQFAS